MQYRPFGRLDLEVSALGFGCMRLPVVGGDATAVDEPLAIEMLRHAIDHGVNYVDTAYPYHGGHSERVLGEALKGGFRERVKLATKLPTWAVKTPGDFDRLLDEQLERLQVEHVDFYLLHNLKATVWPAMRDLGVLEWLERIKADGRAGHVGFSYHDDFPLLKEILDAYDGWAMCQIQYNYMNEDIQAGTRGLEYAAGRGVAVAVMEPLLGGCLVNPPASVQRVWDESGTARTPAEWALQWLWHKPEVSVVLSGMSTMAQVEENLGSAGRSAVGSLTAGDLELVRRVREAYEAVSVVPCTRCGYCMPCPEGVDIPGNLQLYNDALVFGGNQAVLNRNLYNGMAENARASACVACRTCEEGCPQGIEISELMPKVQEAFRR